MAAKQNTGCNSGRGKPVYLLDRINDGWSVDSDYGVSRLFDRSPSIGTSNSSHRSYLSFRSCDSSTAQGMSTLSSLLPDSFEYKSSSNMSSIYGESGGTRSISNKNSSIITDMYSMDDRYERTYESSKLFSTSFVDSSSEIPVCLMKDEHYTANASFNQNYDSNTSFGPEDMFPPYVRQLSDDEDTSEQKQKQDITGGVFHIIEKSIAF
jgi:hypothetical protein